MKWLIITGLLVFLIVVIGTAALVVFAPVPATKLVQIGPTPLDDQIDWAIDHSDL